MICSRREALAVLLPWPGGGTGLKCASDICCVHGARAGFCPVCAGSAGFESRARFLPGCRVLQGMCPGGVGKIGKIPAAGQGLQLPAIYYYGY